MVAVQHEDDLASWQKFTAKAIYIGNLKEIATPNALFIPIDDDSLHGLQAAIGTRPIWLASMLHQGEEYIITQAHHIIKQQYPDILTLILLRHHHILPNLQKAIGNAPYHTRQDMPISNDEFYIIDSYGETDLFYHLCDIICIMGSFGDYGGHNPLPAARYGACLLCGDDMANAQSIYDKLTINNLITRCADSDMLAQQVIDLLANPDQKQQKAQQTKNYVQHLNHNMLNIMLEKLEF